MLLYKELGNLAIDAAAGSARGGVRRRVYGIVEIRWTKWDYGRWPVLNQEKDSAIRIKVVA